MRAPNFAALALVCSGCLEPRSCWELYTCPPEPTTAGDSDSASETDSAAQTVTTDMAVRPTSEVTPPVTPEAGVTSASSSADIPSSVDGTIDAGASSDAAVSSESEPSDVDGSDVDAADAATERSAVIQVVAGRAHTCALLDSGQVRCWGVGDNGRLGYGNTNDVGDDETPATAGDVNIGGHVVRLAAGATHTCALLEGGKVRCWGQGANGQLGYGGADDIGDDETPASAGDVNIGGVVVSLAAGDTHTCALLDTGRVRCWGQGVAGKLGYGNTDTIGDDEVPSSAGDVNVGAIAVGVAAGLAHSCALLETGSVRCWGSGSSGALGYGNAHNVGDDEAPAIAGGVDFGAPAKQLTAGDYHTCVLLDTDAVRCWGQGVYGQLGYGSTNRLGDDEVPATAGDVDVGATVAQVAAAGRTTCAVLDDGRVRCWGVGCDGQLGYGNTETIGDDEVPNAVGDVNVGGVATAVAPGGSHTCALLDSGRVRCWGQGVYGQLGYGNTEKLGDDEAPAAAGDVNVTE